MSKNLVFLTGAGMSVESGFRTFRGADGLWEDEPVEAIATHSGWLRDPERVNKFYNGLRKKLYSAQPNEGHKLIAQMEDTYNVRVVTQNVDDLHERAGSSNVLHLHGELAKVCSSDDPDNERYQRIMPENDCEVKPGERAGDGSLLRPFIVFFEEAVPMMGLAARWVQEADILVIIGTSLVVYPAAGLVNCAKSDADIYLIDPGSVNAGNRVTHIRKGASEGMRELKELLNA